MRGITGVLVVTAAVVAILTGVLVWMRYDENGQNILIREHAAVTNNERLLTPQPIRTDLGDNSSVPPAGSATTPGVLQHSATNTVADGTATSTSPDATGTTTGLPSAAAGSSRHDSPVGTASSRIATTGAETTANATGTTGTTGATTGTTTGTTGTTGATTGTTGTTDANTKTGNKSGTESKTQATAPVVIGNNGTAKLTNSIAHRNWRADLPVVLVVDKADTKTYMLQMHDDNKVYIVYEADNAIGTSQSPTPPGPYKVASKEKQPTWIPPKSIDPQQEPVKPYEKDKDNPLGVAAINLNKWAISLHGTNNPNSIGEKVSHGCIRHRNDDILRIFKAVKPNTTVIIADSIEGTPVSSEMFKLEERQDSKTKS